MFKIATIFAYPISNGQISQSLKVYIHVLHKKVHFTQKGRDMRRILIHLGIVYLSGWQCVFAHVCKGKPSPFPWERP